MSVTENDESVPENFVLGAILDIESVASLYEELKVLVDAANPVLLDGSEVENIDTACLQLLATFFLELHEKNISCTWNEPSEALLHSATVTGLVETLQLPQAA